MSSARKIRFALGGAVVLGVGLGLAASFGEGSRATTPSAVRHASLEQALLQSPAPAPEAATEARAVQRASELSGAFVAISETVTPAVVRIQAERSLGLPERGWLPGLLDPGRQERGHRLPDLAGGTGFLVTSDGFILTNNHVIAGADAIRVSLLDKRQFAATVVGTDPTTDIAVIRIDAEGLPAVVLGDSEAARVGEWVLAVGNPGFGGPTLDFTVTSGIISAKGRPLAIIPDELLHGDNAAAASYAIEDFLQTDAVINPGNSGGPLVNLRGEVIGINTAIASETGFYQGYGFAIPINLARRVMRDLVAEGRVRRPLLGVTIKEIDPEDAEVYSLPSISGVLIQDFPADGSPALAAGLRREDVIIAIDGTPVHRLAQLQRLVAQQQPDDVVRIRVVRFGEMREFDVRLEEAQIPAPPAAAARTGPSPRERAPEAIGLRVVELTPAAAREFGFATAGGALIGDVQPYGVAHAKQVQPGEKIIQLDREPVASAREAIAMLRRVAPGEVISLMLEDNRGRVRIANLRVP